jgi:hypothetical protein
MPEPTAAPSSGTSDAAQTSGQVPTTPPPAVSSGTSEPTTAAANGLSLEQALDALAAARKEAAQHRTKLSAFEKAQADAEAAKLSEQERLTKRVAELEKAKADSERSAQERIVRAEIKAAASTVGIKSELAARLIDYAEIEFTDDGEPKNLAKLLEKLAASYPELVATSNAVATPGAAATRQAAASAGGATNPGRSAGNGGLTLDIIKAMPLRERVARITEIEAWETAQRQTR